MRSRRVLSAAFPGARAVWLGAAIVAAVFAIIVWVALAARPTPLTGTNSVDVAAVVASAKPGEQACIRDLVVPAKSDAVQVFLGMPPAGGRPTALRGTLAAGNVRWPLRLSTVDTTGTFKTFRLDRAPAHDAPGGTLCLRAPTQVDYGGASVQRLPDAAVTSIAGRPLAGVDIGVRFLETRNPPPRFSSQIGTALRRATLFKNYWGGSLVLWVVLAGFVGVTYLAVRTAATVEGRGAGTLARRAYGLALFAGCGWALMMPPFYGADESEHFAYVQHVASAGHRAASLPTQTPWYSTDQQLLLGALHHNSTVLNLSSRPRWSSRYERAYERASRGSPSDSDGSAYSDSASGHSPLYYGLLAVPYRALDWALDLPRLVVALRLMNAALAAFVGALTVLCAAALFPGRPSVWWLAGCLAALQPVFSSVAGTINNDTLVNVLAALALFLAVDAWGDRPQRMRMVTLGVATALLPIAKLTGFAMWPVIAVAVVLVLMRHHKGADLKNVIWAPIAAVGSVVVWLALGGKLVNVHPGQDLGAPSTIHPTLLNKVSYLVQEVVPFVHVTGDSWVQTWPLYSIYVENGYGRVGWVSLGAGLGDGVLHLVLGALILGWLLAVAAAWRARRHWREWLGGVAMLALAIAAVVTLVAFAYASVGPRPVLAEQGRYIFPALLPLAVLTASGALALRGCLRAIYCGGAVSASALLALTTWLTTLRDWFT